MSDVTAASAQFSDGVRRAPAPPPAPPRASARVDLVDVDEKLERILAELKEIRRVLPSYGSMDGQGHGE